MSNKKVRKRKKEYYKTSKVKRSVKSYSSSYPDIQSSYTKKIVVEESIPVTVEQNVPFDSSSMKTNIDGVIPSPVKKEKIHKRRILVSQKTKRIIQDNRIDEDGYEDNSRMRSFEREIRNLYDDSSSVVDDSSSAMDDSSSSNNDFLRENDTSKIELFPENTKTFHVLETDVSIDNKEEEEPSNRRINVLSIITIILFIIFILLFIAFICFLIYVCTY